MTKTITEQTDDLLTLKAQAKDLGLKFHPNIGFSTLQQRVKEKLLEQSAGEQQAIIEPAKEAPAPKTHMKGRQLSKAEIIDMKRKEALELVRVRVTCMNPNKKAWEGEIFSCGNSVVPTQKKYVPFNIPEGWHIPKIMVDMLQSRQYQAFITKRDHRGRAIREGVLKDEFNVEILPPLTQEELKDLKAKQALAAGKVD